MSRLKIPTSAELMDAVRDAHDKSAQIQEGIREAKLREADNAKALKEWLGAMAVGIETGTPIQKIGSLVYLPGAAITAGLQTLNSARETWLSLAAPQMWKSTAKRQADMKMRLANTLVSAKCIPHIVDKDGEKTVLDHTGTIEAARVVTDPDEILPPLTEWSGPFRDVSFLNGKIITGGDYPAAIRLFGTPEQGRVPLVELTIEPPVVYTE